MKRIMLFSAMLLAATSVYAREEKKKAEPKPPPAPVIEYENEDVHILILFQRHASPPLRNRKPTIRETTCW